MTEIMKVGETINAGERMSSRQVAELTGKRHADVIRDIRNLLNQGVTERNFALSEYKDSTGRTLPEYQLTKKGCLILASGYDAVLREKIIDRWEELEKQVKQSLPQTFAEALYLAAQQAEKIEQQQKQIEAQQPKVLFADSVSASKTTILIGELATLIKQNGYDIGQNRLFTWMRENGYLIKRKGSDYNMPTQKSMDMELFTVKETAIVHNDGHVSVSKTVKVTGKGQVHFINKFLKK